MLTSTQKTLLLVCALGIGGYVLITALTPLFSTLSWKEQGWYYVAWAGIIAFHLFNNRTHKPTK